MVFQSITRGVVTWGILVCVGELVIAEDAAPLVVHEWGTFTAFQDDDGIALLGINVDTEPVPKFVHNLGRFILNDAVLSSHHWIHRQKAVPRNHPQVSMRLETPVIYFYPPHGMTLPHSVDVEVKFRGGWLTEFYPQATVQFPIVVNGQFQFTDLTPQTVGNISWHNLQIGTDQEGPETTDHVWLAPRKVAAANLTNADGEHEKYLFYRGVAQQAAPLQIRTKNRGKNPGQSIAISATFQTILKKNQSATIKNLWLMETLGDGRCAYRRLDPLSVVNDGQPIRRIVAPRRFSSLEFGAENRTRLEAEMNEALIREGLFADEAKALLSTWQQAYFTSPGLRLFYTVPREWTDYYLPLTITGETQITRVMIGRIELISDLQRELLDKLPKTPISTGEWLQELPPGSPALEKLLSGRSDIGDIGVEIPPDFQIYLDLGRFRNALVLAEEQRTRAPKLAQFIAVNRLVPFLLSQGSGK